jgi:sporulation integral membrane protein YlbJ
MKRKILNIIIIIITLFLLVQIIIKKSLVFDSINYALNIWVNNLIPTLFPFFIISDILINYKFTDYIPRIFRKICKYLFNITDNMITILILSIISGFPSNARNTRTLYDNGEISLDEANHILIFSHFSNPIFILTTVAIFFFNNQNLGIILLISHYLSNFILGILFRKYFNHDDNFVSNTLDTKKYFGNVFIGAIRKSIDAILLICGIVTVFMLLSSIISSTFYFNIYNSMLVKGILEITIGIEALSKLGLSMTYKAVIASCFLAFGGLSVHMQVMSQIVDTDIKYKYFFVGRIYQMIISGIITYLICLFTL